MFSVPSSVAGEAGEKVRIRIRADENPSRNLSASLRRQFSLFVFIFFPELASEREATFQLFPESAES